MQVKAFNVTLQKFTLMDIGNESIKNLLFDLGGVIIDLKLQNCIDYMTELGMVDADKMFDAYTQTGEFAQLEEGAISPDEFRDAMRKRFTRPVTDEQIDEGICRFLLGLPVNRLKELRTLRKHYKTYLLSNTNPIMFEHKIREYFQQEGLEMEDYFDGIVVSYEAKASKPDPRIFAYTITHLGIKPEETLFFDDSQRNIDAARALGFNVHLVMPGTEFSDYFKNI